MARSDYIYLIRYKDPGTPSDRQVLSGFTVKREAHAWTQCCGHPLTRLQLTRMRDGIGYDKEEHDIPWDLTLLPPNEVTMYTALLVIVAALFLIYLGIAIASLLRPTPPCAKPPKSKTAWNCRVCRAPRSSWTTCTKPLPNL